MVSVTSIRIGVLGGALVAGVGAMVAGPPLRQAFFVISGTLFLFWLVLFVRSLFDL